MNKRSKTIIKRNDAKYTTRIKTKKEIEKLEIEIKNLKISWWKKPSYLTILLTFFSVLGGILTGFINVSTMSIGYEKQINDLRSNFSRDSLKLEKKFQKTHDELFETKESLMNLNSVLEDSTNKLRSTIANLVLIKNQLEKNNQNRIADINFLSDSLRDLQERIISLDEINFTVIDSVKNYQLECRHYNVISGDGWVGYDFYDTSYINLMVNNINIDNHFLSLRISGDTPNDFLTNNLKMILTFLPSDASETVYFDTSFNYQDKQVGKIESYFNEWVNEHCNNKIYVATLIDLDDLLPFIKSAYLIDKQAFIALRIVQRYTDPEQYLLSSKCVYLLRVDKKLF